MADIILDTNDRSTLALMDWLNGHAFPSCFNTVVKTFDGEYFGMISDFDPGDAILDALSEGGPCEYKGMKRWKILSSSWIIHVPGKDKYYFFSI